MYLAFLTVMPNLAVTEIYSIFLSIGKFIDQIRLQIYFFLPITARKEGRFTSFLYFYFLIPKASPFANLVRRTGVGCAPYAPTDAEADEQGHAHKDGGTEPQGNIHLMDVSL